MNSKSGLVKPLTVETPRYEHDCDHCTFLGRFEHDAPHREEGGYLYFVKVKTDLYFCDNLFGEVICRWSSEDSHYSSMNLAMIRSHLLHRKPEDMSTYGAGLVEGYHRAMMLKSKFVQDMNSELAAFKTTWENTGKDQESLERLANEFRERVLVPFCAELVISFEMYPCDGEVTGFAVIKDGVSYPMVFGLESEIEKFLKESSYSTDERDMFQGIFSVLRWSGRLRKTYFSFMDYVKSVN